MPQPQLTNEQQIEECINDLRVAMLADLKAKQAVIEAYTVQKKSHYDLLKARQRLSSLELDII